MVESVTTLVAAVLESLHALTGNYGLAIVALTFLIRIVILPLTASQTRAMKKMQALQPEIQKLQKKHKNDPQRLSQEQMNLFKEHGVNPLGGCLPLLIQLPVLWAFFRTLRNYNFQADPGFLWIPDLAQTDPLFVLPVITAVSTYWMSRMTTPSSAEGTQKAMLYVMPVFLGWIATRFPAGLALYLVATNLFSVGQQYYLEWSDKGPSKKEAE